MLHISPEEQKARLLARLDDPTKHWKFNPNDLAERARWADYRAAYEIALERNNTEHAPWHVIPADKKWYRNLAVGHLLLETLRGLDPQWPEADFDVEPPSGSGCWTRRRSPEMTSPHEAARCAHVSAGTPK